MSTKNEKVIFTVLRKISNDRQFISTAFKSWWADQDSIQFNADDLVAYFESKVGFDANEKRNFRIAFYAISSRNEGALLEVPEVLVQNSGTISKTESEAVVLETEKANLLSPQESTFQLFLDALIDKARSMDADAESDLIEHFQDAKVMKKMKLSKRPASQLNQWLNKNSSQPLDTQSMSVKEMQSMFHQVYICFCETLGPVKADQVLNQAITKVEAMNTGFSVSSLI